MSCSQIVIMPSRFQVDRQNEVQAHEKDSSEQLKAEKHFNWNCRFFQEASHRFEFIEQTVNLSSCFREKISVFEV